MQNCDSGCHDERGEGQMPFRLVLASLFVVAVLAPARGQTPEEHEQHHPATPPATSAPSSPVDQSAPASVSGQTGGEMGQMMRLPPLPPQALYPSLMTVPELTPEARAELERLADERMQAGTALMLAGVERLTAAAAIADYTAMQQAGTEIREGLAQFESGAGTRRALAERRAPRDIALDWFRREMNLLPPDVAATSRGPLGLTWFHMISMLILVAFAVTMVSFYFHKMRRADALLTALAKGGGGGEGGSSPPPAGDGGVSTPTIVPQGPQPPQASSPADRVDTRGQPWKGALRVAAIVPETPDVTTFRLAPAQGLVVPFQHLPGQYVNVFAEIDGKVTKRAYTIASAPSHTQYIEITAKHEPFGVVSGYLRDRARVDAELRVAGPHGYFVFTGAEADSVVLIGGGIGITPLMSIVRYLTDHAWAGDIFLLYSCKTAADVIFRDELTSLQRRHPNLHVVTTFTREEAPGTRTGRVTAALLAELVPGITARRVHVCGPRPMIDAVKQMLAGLGVPASQIKTENFGTATRSPAAVASRAVPPPPPDAAPAALPGRVAVAAPTDHVETVPTITFARSQKAAPAMPHKTVLEVAEVVGVEIDSACRSGTCGSCKVPLQTGRVTMEVEDALEPEDKAHHLILACQAKPVGDVVVEA
ncbi:MAG TPA: 2Fe-2S iron-sulfur cluster-binding protein [Vicinamibacterales bacterium]|nr:2Fe-2S iron-sulfur cluster-binding protein [Vicinamibacterales bacterium]